MKNLIFDDNYGFHQCPHCGAIAFYIVNGKDASLNPEKQALCVRCQKRCVI